MPKNNSKPKNLKALRQQAEKRLPSSVEEKRKLSTTDIHKLTHELDIHQIELQMQNDELQHALCQLEASQKRYFELYEFAPVGYVSLDENNCIIESNITASDLLGVPRTKLINKRFSDFIDKDYQDIFFLLSRKTFATKHKQSYELKLIRKGDIWFYAHIESAVIVNNSINSNHLYLSIIDITIRKQAEEQHQHHQFELNQAAKINALGTLTSALAHELTQPIAATNNFINGCIRRLEKKTYRKNDVLAAMKQARQQIERAGSIIHHLKDFMHKEHSYDEIIDINEVIKEAVHLIKQEPLAMGVKISTQLPHSSTLLLADKLQIELVLLNLMRNSIEAMVDAHIVQPELIIQAIKINNDFIKISISDTGPGITAEVAEKLFEPFFTTKFYGLGIGLAICHNIISDYGGELYLKNGNKRGACFEFTLPITKVQGK